MVVVVAEKGERARKENDSSADRERARREDNSSTDRLRRGRHKSLVGSSWSLSSSERARKEDDSSADRRPERGKGGKEREKKAIARLTD